MGSRESGYYNGPVRIARPTWNLIAAAAIGAIGGTLCWAFLHRFHLGAADFNWAHQAARDLLAGVDPYSHTPPGAIPYPLPAALVALPLAGLPPDVAGGMFFGLSSALLAVGLVRERPERLLIFLAYPYWAALITAQWSPLLMSAAFFPLALAFCPIKPQIGSPIALLHLSRKGVAATSILLIASFLWMPRWLIEWIPQLGGYQHFFPILIFPGMLIVLALLRYRDRDALLLLLYSLMPQRWFYDAFVLWLIPKTRRSILATVICSWIVGYWRASHTPRDMHQVGLWSVLGFYIPMLAVVLLRSRDRQSEPLTSQVISSPDRTPATS
jgi:hypothetical protein